MPTLSQCQKVYDHLEPDLDELFAISPEGEYYKVKEIGDFTVTLTDSRGFDIVINTGDYWDNYEVE